MMCKEPGLGCEGDPEQLDQGRRRVHRAKAKPEQRLKRGPKKRTNPINKAEAGIHREPNRRTDPHGTVLQCHTSIHQSAAGNERRELENATMPAHE